MAQEASLLAALGEMRRLQKKVRQARRARIEVVSQLRSTSRQRFEERRAKSTRRKEEAARERLGSEREIASLLDIGVASKQRELEAATRVRRFEQALRTTQHLS